MRKKYLSLSLIVSFCIFWGHALHSFAQELAVANGKTVSFEYVLTVDGKEEDSSKGKPPLEYVHGERKIIPGLEKQLTGMKVGDSKNVLVLFQEGYGPVDPRGFQEVSLDLLPKDIKLEIGLSLQMRDSVGNSFPCRIKEIKDQSVLVDFNHPLAGKDLHFQVKIVDIK